MGLVGPLRCRLSGWPGSLEMMVNTVIEEVGREGALINRARHPVETPSVL